MPMHKPMRAFTDDQLRLMAIDQSYTPCCAGLGFVHEDDPASRSVNYPNTPTRSRKVRCEACKNPGTFMQLDLLGDDETRLREIIGMNSNPSDSTVATDTAPRDDADQMNRSARPKGVSWFVDFSEPEPAPMSNEEIEKKMDQLKESSDRFLASLPSVAPCRWCGNAHGPHCTLVKSITFRKDGVTVKRVVFQ